MGNSIADQETPSGFILPLKGGGPRLEAGGGGDTRSIFVTPSVTLERDTSPFQGEDKARQVFLIDYCRTQAAWADADLYLLSLFAPAHHRSCAWVWLALFDELAQIPVRASDPTLRLIRLQWWRDQATAVRDGCAVKGHPVMDAWAALPDPGLPVDGLMAAIENMLDLGPHPDRDAVLAVQVRVMGVVLSGLGVDDADLVRAWAILGWVRAHPRDRGLLKELTVPAARNLRGATAVRRAAWALIRLYQVGGMTRPIPFKELRVWWGSLGI